MNKRNFVSTAFLIGLLTVVLFVGVWQIKPVYAITSFGYSTEGGSNWSVGSNVIAACNFSLSDNSNIQNITALRYTSTYGAYYKYAIFGSDLSYKGETIEGQDNSGGVWAWCTLTISGTVALTAGYYLLCEWSNGNEILRYDTGGAGQSFSHAETYSSWPTTLSKDSSFSYQACIYANTTTYAPSSPTYSNMATNTTKISSACNYSITCASSTGLTNAFLEHNETGIKVNATYTFSTSPETANLTVTHNNTIGNVIQYRWFINGTVSGFTTTGYYNITLTTNTASVTLSLPWVNSTRAGNTTMFSVHVNTEDTYSGYYFQSNNTGVQTNSTFTTLTGTGDKDLYYNLTLNSTSLNVVSYVWWVNISGNVWGNTIFYNITTQSDGMWLHTNGEYLQNENGNYIQLQGIHQAGFSDEPTGWWSPNASNMGGYGVWSESAVKENLRAMKAWGANMVRLLARVCWWINDTSDNRQHIKDICTWAKELDMYVQYCFYLVASTGAELTLPYPPYNINAQDNTFLADAQDFTDFWGNMSQEMRDYDNFIMWLFGEPDIPSSDHKAWWITCQNTITQIRGNETGNVPHLVVVGVNKGVWCNIETNATGTGVEWVAGASGNITDPSNSIIYGVDFYRSAAGTGFFNNFTTGWTYTHILSALQIEQFDYVTKTLHKPFIIGETSFAIGAGDLDQEKLAWINLFDALDYYNISYSALWWRSDSTGMCGPLLGQGPYVPLPSSWGGMGYVQHLNKRPFIWSVGNESVVGISGYYIYSNNTSWSSTWSGSQLNVSFTGSYTKEVRIFWNVSNTNYPINSTLQCKDEDGNIINALTYYDSVFNLIRLICIGEGNRLIGYNLATTVSISSPMNTTYTSSSISVSLSASGGTIDVIWWNCKNGTAWIYGSNQTYTTPTSMTGFVDGTSYTFYAWANNTVGDVDEETVMFTVGILIVEIEWGGYWGRWWGYP